MVAFLANKQIARDLGDVSVTRPNGGFRRRFAVARPNSVTVVCGARCSQLPVGPKFDFSKEIRDAAVYGYSSQDRWPDR